MADSVFFASTRRRFAYFKGVVGTRTIDFNVKYIYTESCANADSHYQTTN